MTLRIFEEARKDDAVIALHGALTAAEVAELERLAGERGRPLCVDRVHLVLVDAEGLRARGRLRAGGARLTGASHFIELMLERTGAADGSKTGRTSHGGEE